MLVKTFGSAVYGIEATTITVEVNITGGTKYYVVGLPDNAIKESYFRVKSALKNCNYHMPKQQVVVNMAPADVRKEGSSYDLTIAIGVLAASGQIMHDELDKISHHGRTIFRRRLTAYSGRASNCYPGAKRRL